MEYAGRARRTTTGVCDAADGAVGRGGPGHGARARRMHRRRGRGVPGPDGRGHGGPGGPGPGGLRRGGHGGLQREDRPHARPRPGVQRVGRGTRRRPVRVRAPAVQGLRRRRAAAEHRLGRAGRGAPPGRVVARLQRVGRRGQPASGGRRARTPSSARPGRSCRPRWSSPCPSRWPTRSGTRTTPIGWPDILELARSDEGWAAFGHPEWGPFRLGKTNPNFSTSGLSALIAQNYAAVGTTRDLTLEDLDRPAVQQFAA